MMLILQTAKDLAVISDLYSLLEDYMTMACSGKSLLCCQPPVWHALVNCLLCGKHFMGKTDRLLKLCKHFESVHPRIASDLIFEAIERYELSIAHMRKALAFDKCFGASRYKSTTRFSLHNA